MSYTQQVEDQYFSFADEEMYKLRVGLENMSEDASEAEWKEKIMAIAEEYRYSSRYFVIRFLLSEEELPSMEEIKSLSEEQIKKYEEELLQIAAKRKDFNEERAELLIRKAMFDSKKETKKKALLLTREEAFELGHMLGFSLGQMKACLLRVLENDDGFSMKSSNDLIEAYGFLQDLSSSQVAEIKRAYEGITDDTEKVSDVEANFTRKIESSIIAKVSEWNGMDTEEKEQKFLGWLEEKSAYLDSPSNTALRIYRNLVAYAYDLLMDIEELPEEEELLDCIKEVTNYPKESDQVKKYFYDEKGKIAKKECKKIIDTLIDIDTWKIIHVGTDGKPKSDTCTKQILSIVTGKVSPQKSDMLYLLWFVENMCWNVGKEHPDGDLFNRIADLFDLADDTLRLALLPDFYPPHLLEQSMLLSIVNSQNYNPSDVYDTICDTLIERRKRTTGARKHSKEEKLQAVLELEDNMKNIQEVCKKYQVSSASLYAWRAKYLKEGKI